MSVFKDFTDMIISMQLENKRVSVSKNKRNTTICLWDGIYQIELDFNNETGNLLGWCVINTREEEQ
jgi:hypothetical protein